LTDFAEIFNSFDKEKGSLITLLQQVQQKIGYLSEEAISEIAKFTKLSESYIFGVASFYSQFYFTRRGRHIIKICLGTACHVRGNQVIMDEISRHLSTESGKTTEDNRYTLDVYGRMTVPRAKEILNKYE